MAALDPVSDSVSGPVPDPFDDAEALGELEHEIATLAAHISAATYRLLTLIADFDRRRGWGLGGHRSCAHWLHATTGMDLGAAREKVRTARALAGLPRTSEVMARGELSFSAVRALTRVATPECEEELLEVARISTTAQLERFVRAWRTLSRADEAKLERERWRSRRLSVFPDDEGMYVVRGRLPAETGALLMRAVEAAGDALYRKERVDGECVGGKRGTSKDEDITPKQRRADAIGLVAERAMAVGFGTESADRVSGQAEDGEALEVSQTPAPVSGTRAERYQVMLHLDAETLRSREGRDEEVAGGSRWGTDGRTTSLDVGRSHLEDGTRVSAETSRRLSCDASVVEVVRGPRRNHPTNGEDGTGTRRGSRERGGAGDLSGAPAPVLDVGRRTRTIHPALRRALEVRDRGCRFPGCGLRFTDGHHVKHWADGGETRLGNLILLCRFHHRLVHEGGWRVEFWGRGNERRPAFIDPRGGIRMDVEWGMEVDLEADFEGDVEGHLEGNAERESGGRVDGASERTAVVSGRTTHVPDRPEEALVRGNRARGIEPDGWKLGPEVASPSPGSWTAGWRPSDARRAIEDRALEALDEAHFSG